MDFFMSAGILPVASHISFSVSLPPSVLYGTVYDGFLALTAAARFAAACARYVPFGQPGRSSISDLLDVAGSPPAPQWLSPSVP